MRATRWARRTHGVPQGLLRVRWRGQVCAFSLFVVAGFTVALFTGGKQNNIQSPMSFYCLTVEGNAVGGAYRQEGLLARTGWRPGQAYSTTWNEGKDVRQQREQPEWIRSNSSCHVFQPAVNFSDLQKAWRPSKLMLCFGLCRDVFSRRNWKFSIILSKLVQSLVQMV